MNLATKHRPSEWQGLWGRTQTVAGESITAAVDRGTQAFLLSGPPGTGKTTIARILSTHVGGVYHEYDAATRTGVDDARNLISLSKVVPPGGRTCVFIIDECHMMTKQAWNAMLKTIEEPPKHAVWVFCTTELSKVPKSIQSRCNHHKLTPLSDDEMYGLIEGAAEREGLSVDDAIAELLVEHAQGIPRDALVALDMVQHVLHDPKAVRSVLDSEEGYTADVMDLCRKLVQPRAASFPALAKIVAKLEGTMTAEAVRNVVCGYFSKVAQGKHWKVACAVLQAFSEEYPSSAGTRMYPVLVSLSHLFED